ncbi:MAG: HAMP domain-containing histidine kinase [Firmicutes bacterium]|nr:HAMP domain-containing histidine kinase [Bacillota bacterium]
MKIASLIFIVLSLFFFGFLTILSNPQSRSNRWLGTMALAPGLGVFGVILNYLSATYLPKESLLNFSFLATNCLYLLALYITPYATLLFGINYSGLAPKNSFRYKLMIGLLLIPILIMIMLYPFYGVSKTLLIILSVWAIPYILAANCLVIYAYYKEKDRRLKQQKLLTCILFLPATLLIEAVNIVILPNHDIWKFNAFSVVSTFLLSLFLSIRYGILGAKIKLERDQLAGTIHSITSGTLILNHTIKNEINKISVCMENIKNAAQLSSVNRDGINKNIQFAQNSLNYLSQMVKRIQNQMKEIIIIKEPTNLGMLATKTLQLLAALIQEKNIQVENTIDPLIQIPADSFHLQEVFNNIIRNAIEAMSQNGILYLGVIKKKRTVTILIRDNGAGIAKENRPQVMEPFFTTKSRQKNFGLGLAYCDTVIQKHGGNLEIESVEKIGTTVLLTFPIPRYKKLSSKRHNLYSEACS